MIMFFYFTELINVQQDEFGVKTLHKFEAAKGDRISSEKIYFSTPSDFQGHAKRIEEQLGPKKDRIFVMPPAKVIENPQWPKDIGFKNLEEQVEEFKGRPVFKLAFINGMSNALGDHLIGINAQRRCHRTIPVYTKSQVKENACIISRKYIPVESYPLRSC